MKKTCSNGRSLVPWISAIGLCTAAAQAQFTYPGFSRVDLYKGQCSTQTASGVVAAAPNPYVFQVLAQPISAGIVTAASVSTPSGGNYPLANVSGGNMGYTGYGASASAFDAAYGTGNYSVRYHYSLGGFLSGDATNVLALASGAYPAAPHLSNFSAAQSLDVASDFTFSWSSFTGNGADDFIQFQILDGTSVVYDSGIGMNANLSGSDTSDTVVADTLTTGKTYTGRLIFYSVTSLNTSSDTTTSVGYSSETTFTIKTGGSGPVDTTPPTLTTSTPANNAVNVLTTGFQPIIFTFSEPMAETESIQWSANVIGSSFTYLWSADKTSLMCYYAAGLPGSSTITWTLNPTAGNSANFRDLAGNVLAINTYTGKFTTVQGPTNNPCSDTNTLNQTAGVTVSKLYNYLQTSVAAPVFDPVEGAFFSASLRGPSTLTAASVVVPSTPAATHPLEVLSIFGNASAYYDDQQTNLTAFDAAYPPGDYQISAVSAGTTYNTTAPLPDSGKPTVPHVANFTAAQSVDPNADFTLQWDVYPSPTAFDVISLTISDATNMVFHAPDKCIPINLDATATSIVIPKGTFQPGISYTGSLQFFHLASTDITLLPGGSPGMSGLSRTTKFKLTTTGGVTLPAPVISNAKVLNKTQIQFQVTCTTGHSLVIRSTPDFKTFTPAYTTNVTTSPVTVTIPLGADTRMFYQAVQ
jgi:hypothetical protein